VSSREPGVEPLPKIINEQSETGESMAALIER
jgi:hypothetical protein